MKYKLLEVWQFCSLWEGMQNSDIEELIDRRGARWVDFEEPRLGYGIYKIFEDGTWKLHKENFDSSD